MTVGGRLIKMHLQLRPVDAGNKLAVRSGTEKTAAGFLQQAVHGQQTAARIGSGHHAAALPDININRVVKGIVRRSFTGQQISENTDLDIRSVPGLRLHHAVVACQFFSGELNGLVSGWTHLEPPRIRLKLLAWRLFCLQVFHIVRIQDMGLPFT